MKSGFFGVVPPQRTLARAGVRIAKSGLTLFTALLTTGAAFSQAQPWNLPYVRPTAYDYKALYAPNMNAYITSLNPTYFKQELQNSWGYYKQNFIMTNGLVNHKRLQGTTQIGANEAVSEGQGYGLLLAVLLNDQPTFNKILEAANTHMWDNTRKSYFKWSWPSGSQGAATDGDLDIGLALVFAADLQKAGFWQAYSAGGITYHSRAMDIIKSIKSNMTAQDQLLPGDNWGGDGINNLNPSYFATAWLKVFNAYQKEVDFTAVINNCYTVLAKVPRYSFGQAPDWCNPSGGQANQAGSKPEQGMGMLSDGIRTPWRIGIDALWFKDARAIAYCKNTMKTLTEYNNSNILMMAAQMAHYTKSGQAVLETKGSFDNIAMWVTAALGSGETAFTQKATDSQIIGRISGSSSPHFGDLALQDDKFYYKQSIGMLGFAIIGGQFPNLLADEKIKPNPVLVLDRRAGAMGKAAMRMSRGQTLTWLSPEGVPTVNVPGGTDAAVYRNALGRKALLLP